MGHEAEHVIDIGLRDSKDSPIWNHAAEHSAVIITKDADFALRRNQSRGSYPIVVWLRAGNTIRRMILGIVDNMLPSIEEHIRQGNQLIEIR